MAVMRYQEGAAPRDDGRDGRDDNVFLCGEEIAQYQGTYRVTEGLLQKFGPRPRVDTRSARSNRGSSDRAAMAGLRPVAGFMTWSFALEAMTNS